MAELADVPDLGSGAPGVQVRPLLAAPQQMTDFQLSAVFIYSGRIGRTVFSLRLAHHNSNYIFIQYNFYIP